MNNYQATEPVEAKTSRKVRVLSACAVAVMTSVVLASPAAAQAVSGSPTTSGIPGGAMVQKVIDWGMQYSLWAILLGAIAGIGAWVFGAMSNNGGRQASGQKVLATMCAAALALGVAPQLINLFFAAG